MLTLKENHFCKLLTFNVRLLRADLPTSPKVRSPYRTPHFRVWCFDQHAFASLPVNSPGPFRIPRTCLTDSRHVTSFRTAHFELLRTSSPFAKSLRIKLLLESGSLVNAFSSRFTVVPGPLGFHKTSSHSSPPFNGASFDSDAKESAFKGFSSSPGSFKPVSELPPGC